MVKKKTAKKKRSKPETVQATCPKCQTRNHVKTEHCFLYEIKPTQGEDFDRITYSCPNCDDIVKSNIWL